MSSADVNIAKPDADVDELPLDLPDSGLLAAIVRLNLLVGQVLEDIVGESDLTFADYLVLGVVRRSPDERSAPTAIAHVLGRTTGGMTLALDRLEAAGLLRRTRHADDGRRVVVELTERGRQVATTVNDALHEWEAALRLPMPADHAIRTLEDLTAAVDASPRPPIS
jgi:DNA-binding MarR family transcriptional regulator